MKSTDFKTNFNSMFEEQGLEIRFVEDESYDGVIVGEDHKLNAFPIVNKEEKMKYKNDNECYVIVSLCSRGEVTEAIKIKSTQLDKPESYISKFGAKPFADFNGNDWENFFLIAKTMLAHAEQETTYSYMGYSNNLESCIFGSLEIDANNVMQVRSSMLKQEVIVSNAPMQVVCKKVNDIFLNITKEPFVGYTLMLHGLLGLIKPRMIRAYNLAPGHLLAMIGTTGSFKTSTATAVFNPLGITNASFEDTEASIRKIFQDCGVGTTIIDDYKIQNAKTDKKFEKIIRMAGDVGATSKKLVGDKVCGDSVEGMAVITGEVRPRLQDSSYARALFIDLDRSPVEKEVLTMLQNGQAEYLKFLIAFIQLTMDANFDEDILNRFNILRDELMKNESYRMHSRYYSMYAWIVCVWEVYVRFVASFGVNIDNDYPQKLLEQLYNQHCMYENDPVKLFKKAYFELMDSNKLVVVKSGDVRNKDFDIIDYSDTLFVQGGRFYEKVCAHLKKQGIEFPCSERCLYKYLYKADILKQESGKNTKEKKIYGESCSGYFLYKYYLNSYGGNDNEEF